MDSCKFNIGDIVTFIGNRVSSSGLNQFVSWFPELGKYVGCKCSICEVYTTSDLYEYVYKVKFDYDHCEKTLYINESWISLFDEDDEHIDIVDIGFLMV